MKQRVELADDRAAERRFRRRDEADFILEMSVHLASRDRLLIDFIYGQGRSVVEYARLARCSVRAAQRRLHGLLDRISSRNFRYILTHESDLPRDYRVLARRLILEGRGIRSTSKLTGRSLHKIRCQRIELLAILAAHQKK